METTSIIFITGGVRSGKSSFAEKVAIDKAKKIDGSLHYIATGMPSDHEMKERIIRHQKDRNKSECNWQTWEQSTNIEELASYFKENDVILLDCLTTLLSNELFSDEADWSNPILHKETVFNRIVTGIKAIEKNCHDLVLVSNELLFEPINSNELLSTYSGLIGKLHQHMVGIANQAYEVQAGLPLLWKGDKQ
ncbi:bifunctional adenosylcobinamide kinase/adenosylcobinamide-phosphate guanylyltransferase [Bacillus sp. JJ1533]|uniref:bifunctional adenosylcobinamide kinase/adenosylcobinamide-phosphate guanylyltransferase n=1 Tax=Bacillus sp. JJ1533 TaxID=3122959 RepID=UPI003000C743